MDVHPTKNGINRYWSIPISESPNSVELQSWQSTAWPIYDCLAPLDNPLGFESEVRNYGGGTYGWNVGGMLVIFVVYLWCILNFCLRCWSMDVYGGFPVNSFVGKSERAPWSKCKGYPKDCMVGLKNDQSLLNFHRPSQEPKLEVPTIYKAYIRPM